MTLSAFSERQKAANVKTIIAGSRTITDRSVVEAAIKASGFLISHIVSGGASAGADRIAIDIAKDRHLGLTVMPADWEKYGRSAGFKRNQKMAECGAVALIAVWDGESRGTAHMIKTAKSNGLAVFVFNTSKPKLEWN